MKLLNKSISLYILYAAILLMAVMPVLYFTIQKRVLEEVDESLLEQKNKITARLEKTDEASLLAWIQHNETDATLTIAISQNNTTDQFYSIKNFSRHNNRLRNRNTTDKFYSIKNFDSAVNENSPYRILETSLPLHGKLYKMKLKSSLLDSEDLIESIVKITALLLLLIIAGMVLITRLLSKKLWKPFYSTINKLNGFTLDSNKHLEFDSTNIHEFKDLNKVITALTSRSRETYLSQKEFTENASHEMQTPLAVLQAKLDVLMQTNPLTEEQSELISDLADVNQRMNRLNKTLLLLTKIENNQFAETEVIAIPEVLKKLVEQYSFQAAQKGITIKLECTDGFEFTANKMLIEIMLGNLLNNAVKHNIAGGEVSIHLNGGALTCRNSAGSAPLDGDKIFQRFHKQSAGSNGLGLGLQIAKKIAENYGCSIRYKFEKQLHTFSVFFPVLPVSRQGN